MKAKPPPWITPFINRHQRTDDTSQSRTEQRKETHWRTPRIASINGGPHAHLPPQGRRRRLPGPPRHRRPRQDRPHARRARRPRRRRRRAPRRRPPRPPPRPDRRALLPQHRRAGGDVPGGDPRSGRGGAAQPGLHAGRVRVLPLRLGRAPARHRRRRQRARAGRRRQARPPPRRRRHAHRRRRPARPHRPPGHPERHRPTRRRPSRRQRAVGRGPVPAHLRHDEPAQGRAAYAAQPGGLRPEHPRRVPVRGDGRYGGDAAAVPRARPHVRAPLLAGLRRVRGAPGRRPLLGVHLLVRHARGRRHVVHGGAHHPPDHPGPARVPAGAAVPCAPVRAQLQRVAGAGDPGAAGDGLRGAGARSLRHDGGLPHDDLQPAATGRGPEARDRRARGGGDGGGGAGRGREAGPRRGARGGVHPRAERDGRVQDGGPGRELGGVPARVVPHGGHRRDGRRGVREPGGADQGAHQPGRREDLAHRGGLCAAGPPGRGAGGVVRRPRRQVRRGDPLRGDPPGRGRGGGGAGRGGGGGLLPEEPGGVQGAQEGVHRRRPPQDRHRQDPAPHRRATLLRAACARRQGLESIDRRSSRTWSSFVCLFTGRTKQGIDI